jgi:CheY-like chemotaxis protein
MIDDDAEFVEAISNLLDAKGYEVINASDGEKGILMAHEHKPDIILLDVMMTTNTEGFDAAKRIKSDGKLSGIPIIMLSGIRKEMNLPFAFEPDEENLPVKEFIEKPVTPDVLLKAIEKYI